MHAAHRISFAWSCASCCGVSCPELGATLCGSRLAHAVCAEVNAGELVEPWYERPPLLVGSGKFVTPCERMHRAYARAWLARLEAVEFDPDGGPLDPHAAIVSAQAAGRLKMRNRDMPRRWLPTALVRLAPCNVVGLPQARSMVGHPGYTASGITRR